MIWSSRRALGLAPQAAVRNSKECLLSHLIPFHIPLLFQVSVVQPVSSVGLVFLMIFSHFYLKERLLPQEWVAAAIAGTGIVGLGASSEPEPPSTAPAGAAAAAAVIPLPPSQVRGSLV